MSWGKVKIDKADKYFSLWIRTRDKWKCQRCGRKYEPPTNALHCSHFKGRRKESVRFDPINADALCFHCHQHFTSQPDEHTAWQIKRKGQKTVDKIILASHTYKKKERELEAMYWKDKLKKDFGVEV